MLDSECVTEVELRRDLVRFSRLLYRLGYMPGTSGSSGAVPANHLLERSALAERAAQVGNALGRAVATVRRGRGNDLPPRPLN